MKMILTLNMNLKMLKPIFDKGFVTQYSSLIFQGIEGLG
jgi:hypothetical protein